MAVFNGARYLRAQLESILTQLGEADEVVLVDDGSCDRSLDIAYDFRDQRIRIHLNSARLGHVQNFAHAISLARGDIIVLSDQDDRWIAGRLSKFVQSLEDCTGAALIVGDFVELDDDDNLLSTVNNETPLPARVGNTARIIFDIFLGRRKYYGCCFAFNRKAVPFILPIPAKVEAHDLWIALVISVVGQIRHLCEPTLLRRIHEKNLTPPKRRNLLHVAWSRMKYLAALMQLFLARTLATRQSR